MNDLIKSLDFQFFGNGNHKITPEKLLTEGGFFLDVRSNEEVKSITLNFELYGVKTITIPTDEIDDRLSDIPKSRIVAIFCPGAVRASMVYIYLRSKGYENIRIIEGGYDALISFAKPGKLLKQIKLNN